MNPMLWRSMNIAPHSGWAAKRGWFVGAALVLSIASIALAQDQSSLPRLARNRYRNGEETLRAFAPISDATRRSIVKLNVDGSTVALGVVVDTNGLALTKASEIKPGKLTCWLATEDEVPAEVLAANEEEDLALVRVHAQGLRPLPWSTNAVFEGQWVITPGIADTPHSVGIISALPRRIRPRRAYIGVQFNLTNATPIIDELLPGLGAEKAGLKPGDIILAVNGSDVTNREQIVETLREYRDGTTIKLKIRRAEKDFEVDVKMMLPGANQLGFDPQERSSRLAGQTSKRAEGFDQAIEHDTVLQPWLCGGPLVNLDGNGIGINIARAGRVTTYALPASLVRQVLASLEAKVESKAAANN